MFAYCQNNPVMFVDPNGHTSIAIGASAAAAVAVAAVAAAAVVIATHNAAKETAKALDSVFPDSKKTFGDDIIVGTVLVAVAKQVVDVYMYSKAISQKLKKSSERIPHVHHIVPVGKFSNRSQTTITQINQMHEKLENAGINRYIDPINLVLVSAKTHARLHTDAYIDHVHSYIMSAGNDTLDIYEALFYLRLEIAAWDASAFGY